MLDKLKALFNKESLKEDPNLKSLNCKVGDIINGETVVEKKPCVDDDGWWTKLTTKTENNELKVYEVFYTSKGIVKRPHNEHTSDQ